LGKGTYGVVFLFEKNNISCAIKTINKKLFERSQKVMELTLSEIHILCRINCPNVIKLYESFESENFVFMVLEYANDGDMGSHIQKMKDKGIFGVKENEAIDYIS
jgi:serine/threonine protein kinase